jgi:ABC-type multidrug transport system fused ATPase/permease subunit
LLIGDLHLFQSFLPNPDSCYLLFKESVNRSYIKVRNAVAALNAFVQEHITGMFVVQAFAAEDREFKNLMLLIRNIEMLILDPFLLILFSFLL